MAVNLNKYTVYRTAKPNEKDYTISDGGGLFLFAGASGSKLWRFVYTFSGKRKKIAFGPYPDNTLETARRKAEEARNQIANGIDPGAVRKEFKAAKQQVVEDQARLDAGLPIINSFEHVCREWLATTAHTVRDITQQKKIRRLELYVFPAIGNKPIGEIKSPDVFGIIKPLIVKNQLETTHRVHSEIGAAFAYAIAHGYTDYDPANAVGAQIPAQKVRHNAAITEPKEVAQLLRDIYAYQGTYVVQCALKLSPYLFQRPGEIRQMEWKDIDLATREWRYFVAKTEVQHIVPLSDQAITALESIKPLTGSGRYVFPSSRGRRPAHVGRHDQNGT